MSDLEEAVAQHLDENRVTELIKYEVNQLLQTQSIPLASIEQVNELKELIANLPNLKAEYDELKNEIAKCKKNLTQKTTTLEEKYSIIEAKSENAEKLQTTITTLLNEATQTDTSIQNIINDVNTKKSECDNLITTVKIEHEDIKTKYSQIEDFHTDISGYYAQVFNGQVDSAGAVIKPSIKADIDKLKSIIIGVNKETKDMYNANEKEFIELKEDLKQKILDLLPGAGAAGLAESYCESKKDYNVTGWDQFMFFGPLILISGYAFHLLQALNITTSVSWPLLGAFFGRLTASIPLIWITIYSHNTLQQKKRLFEEYNHKQRVMSTYYSFKDLLNDPALDDEELLELRKIMLEVVNHRPITSIEKLEKNETKVVGIIFDRLSEISTNLSKLLKIGTS